MDIREYFDSMKGCGILATADSKGLVGAAMYARPHVVDEETVAFIMLDRLTRHNLQSNPHAAYLFMEDGGGYRGKRFFLTKLQEEQDTDEIDELCRRWYLSVKEKEEFLVYFRIDKVLPLIETGEGLAALNDEQLN
jgi:hypothetical protein